MTSPLVLDDLKIEVRWSPRRRTLGLTVDRGGELIVHAPVGSDPSLLEAFVRENGTGMLTTKGGRELSFAIQDKRLDRLITPDHRHRAKGEIRSEEAIRLGTHSGQSGNASRRGFLAWR